MQENKTLSRAEWLDKIFGTPVFAVLLAIFCNVLWGSAFPFIKLGYRLFAIDSADTASILCFAGVRFMIGAALVWLAGLALTHRPLPMPRGKTLASACGLGLWQTAAQYIFYYSAVALLRPDGTLLLTDGARYDVSDTFDFETEAARGAYISDRVTSYFAPEKLVVRNVVPVKRDGETIAILYGVVLLQELSRNYQIDLYNGNAVLLLVDGNNGDILLDTWHDSLGNLSDLSGRKMLMGYTYEEAMEKIPNGIGGDMCIVSRSTGLTLYLHYEPVGINNWSVVLGVSEQDALAGTRGVVKILYLMSVIVGAILLSYLAYISWYLISARRGVYRMSITDQGTGLMNRVAYEKCLRKSDQRVIAPAACIYIDVNGLQIDGPTAKVMNSEPLDQKMDAFGFNTIICNGNSLADLEQAFILFDRSHGSGKPTCFLLHTTKGLGVSFMENAVDWHGKAPNDAEYDKAMAELRASYEVMEKEAERING